MFFFRHTTLLKRKKEISKLRSSGVINDTQATRLLTLAKAEAGVLKYKRYLKMLLEARNTGKSEPTG